MPDPRIFPIPSAIDTFATVGVAPIVVLAANMYRGDTDLINTSSNWIYLGRGNAAIVGSGEALAPRGGSYHIGTDNMFEGIIYAIASGAGSNLAISEGAAK